jgi:SAM-dependent methyltransferase
MPPKLESQAPTVAASAEEFVDRVYRAAISMFEILTIYLGHRVGLYEALARGGPATSVELAERTGTNERYVREWLEQQAANAIVEVDDVKASATARRYSLPTAHVEVLADPESLLFTAPLSVALVRGTRPLADLVEAFRTGDAPPALPWEPEGRPEENRVLYRRLLGREWLPSIPDVHARLNDDPPARIADVGCGTGWSSIAMALSYPKVRLDGFDLDEAAIAKARQNAQGEGVTDRVTFFARDGSDPEFTGRYDLVTIFEALHDMARPVEVLSTMRSLLTERGSVIVADERAGEEFTAPADDVERFLYGWSVIGCLPAAMGDPETAATGTVMRPGTLRRYAEGAGFTRVEILPIENDFWRFYRLFP